MNNLNAETERMYLGSLLIALLKGKTPGIRLTGKDFTTPDYKLVFETIVKQIEDPGIAEPNIVTLYRALPEVNPGLIAGLPDAVPSDANIRYFETAILRESKKRRFTSGLKKALSNAHTWDADVDEVISGLAETLLEETAERTAEYRYADWTAYDSECARYDPAQDFSLFKEIRCPNGTLSYIGARPGGGKTTLLINAVKDALAQGRRAFFVNLEMSNKQIITNIILSMMYGSHREALDREKIENPLALYYGLFKDSVTAPASFVKARGEARETLAALLGKRLFIYDGIGQKLNGIITAVRAGTEPGDVVLVDYVQRLPAEGNVQRYLEIKAGSNALLELAVRNSVAVIAGAQLNRRAEEGEASLADFREGGDIEADAHNAVAVEKDYLHVLKAREGMSGRKFALDWRKEYCAMRITGVYQMRQKSGADTGRRRYE